MAAGFARREENALASYLVLANLRKRAHQGDLH
jgi:hypothetical protein